MSGGTCSTVGATASVDLPVSAATRSHMSVRAVITTRSGDGAAQLVVRASRNAVRSASPVIVTSSSAWSTTTSTLVSAEAPPDSRSSRTYSAIPPGVRSSAAQRSASRSAPARLAASASASDISARGTSEGVHGSLITQSLETRSAGTSPARTRLDLPLPDGPSTGMTTPSRPRLGGSTSWRSWSIWRSRPKNTAAYVSSKARSPGNGERPASQRASCSRPSAASAARTRSRSIWPVLILSPCRSAVSGCGSLPSTSRARIGLRSQRVSASSEWHHWLAIEVGVVTNTTASQASRFVNSWSRHAWPGTSPPVGSKSRKTEP